MKQFLYVISSLYFSSYIQAQIPQKEYLSLDSLLITNLSQYRIETPVSLNGEVFTNGAFDYKVSDKISVGLERDYAKFGTHERISPSVVFTYDVNEKKYVFFRGGPTYDINQVTGKAEGNLINVNLGIGYRIKKKMKLEIGVQLGRTIIPDLPPTNQFLLSVRFRF
ncbi:hypothetical protein [Zobellia alginiliquefaciens]|uniref:hypothetical protein n=1 Tax=Zobellia alginiliquefaciens TaxID=3032586 RepID=UPI0023E3A341|nr:hypothetical protein [Zobellia alginiliquefaciens]